MTMTLDQLARRARVSQLDLHEWLALGLIGQDGDGFGAEALARARILRVATARGLTAADIAAASARDGDILGRFVAYASHHAGDPIEIDAAAATAGIDPVLARRIRVAAALAEEEADEGDLWAMRGIRAALDAGLPQEALLQLVRVYADALGRVADAEIRLFHFYVHEELRASGASPEEAATATAASTDALLSLVEPTVLYFHRKERQPTLAHDRRCRNQRPGDPTEQADPSFPHPEPLQRRIVG